MLADTAPPAPKSPSSASRIADERHGVIGYELLFGGERQSLDPATDAKATSALLVDAFGDIGLDALAGRHPAWMSIARNFLVEIGPPPVRPDRAVLQIAAYEARDDLLGVAAAARPQRLHAGPRRLRRPRRPRRAARALLDREGRVVGRDDARARRASSPRRRRTARSSWPPASPAPTTSTAAARSASPTSRATSSPSRAWCATAAWAPAATSSLRALGELSAADASFEDLERIISSDVGLSLKLLRYVNSAFFALPRTIGSVREALSLLGTRTIRRWATVMAMSAIPDAPHELVAIALHRARMCEMLAGNAPADDRETLFTIGLFSVADGLMDMTMEEVLESLPFADEIRAALLRHDGPKGELLARRARLRARRVPERPLRRRRQRLARRRVPRRARVGRRGRPRGRLTAAGAHSVRA